MASWPDNHLQVAFRCWDCKTEIDENRETLLDDVKGATRRDFDSFWLRYRAEIAKLTAGKSEEKFKLKGQ